MLTKEIVGEAARRFLRNTARAAGIRDALEREEPTLAELVEDCVSVSLGRVNRSGRDLLGLPTETMRVLGFELGNLGAVVHWASCVSHDVRPSSAWERGSLRSSSLSAQDREQWLREFILEPQSLLEREQEQEPNLQLLLHQAVVSLFERHEDVVSQLAAKTTEAVVSEVARLGCVISRATRTVCLDGGRGAGSDSGNSPEL